MVVYETVLERNGDEVGPLSCEALTAFIQHDTEIKEALATRNNVQCCVWGLRPILEGVQYDRIDVATHYAYP